jgi:lysozyme
MSDKVKKMLIKNEGMMCNLYTCKAGKISIGVGRNLTDRGISEDEAMYMLNNDEKETYNNLDKHWIIWRSFPENAQLVCVDMTYNLGIIGFMGFRKTRELMELGMWLEASEELLDSKYAVQLPNRSLKNSALLSSCNKDGKDIRRSSK